MSIWNKKIYAPFFFLESVAIKMLNLSILMFVIDMFFRVSIAKESAWYYQVTGEMQQTDIFFREKSDMIFGTLALVIGLLLFFCGFVVCFFQKQQMENAKQEIGMVFVSGYHKKQIFAILFADAVIDFMAALGIGIGVCFTARTIVTKNEIFQSFYQITAENKITGMLACVLSMLFFILLIAVQIWTWLEKEQNKGIGSMLKETS